MIQLKSFLRGLPYDEKTFLSDIQVIDNTVIDLCPPIGRLSKKYDNKFTSE